MGTNLSQRELMQQLIEVQLAVTETNRQAIAAAEKNQKAVEANTVEVQGLRREMETHNLRQEPFEKDIKTIKLDLYGDQDHKGYLKRFDWLEERGIGIMKSISVALWVIVSAFLGAFGLWLWSALTAGAIPK